MSIKRTIVSVLLSLVASLVAQEADSSTRAMLQYARGHQEFKEVYFKQHEEEFQRLVKQGQAPETLYIGCSDSRVVPNLILGTKPGELFVIRTAGNFVPLYDEEADDGVSATVQYAVEVVNVKHIIVCGHSHCGAIKGLYDPLDKKFAVLKRWLKWGEEAKAMALKTTNQKASKEQIYKMTEQLSVIYQLKHILSFPYIKKRVEEGKLELHGWYYEIETGDLYFYECGSCSFQKATSPNVKADWIKSAPADK